MRPWPLLDSSLTRAADPLMGGADPKTNAFFSGREIQGEVTNPGRTELEIGKAFLLGMTRRAQDMTDDERVSGELTIEANVCLDAVTACGPMWGTFVLENPAGKWLAAWIGQKTSQGVTIYAMGYGIGAYQDLMANWTYTRSGLDPQTPLMLQGFIVRTSNLGSPADISNNQF
jgi:hypothetical protein